MTIPPKSRFSVFVADAVDPSGLAVLHSIAQVVIQTKLSEAEICEIIPTFDAMIVRSSTKVTRKIIEAGKNLKIIGRAGVGVDNVDVPAATENGIFVVNSPLGNVVAAAEHTLAMMFALARNIPAADASVRRGEWDRSVLGTQLRGKTLGIIGLGQVGCHVAKVAGEMGMRLIGYDPHVNDRRAETLRCQMLSDLDQLCVESDFITLHVPLIGETKHMIDTRRLSLMKPTARVINVSRGGVIDEAALCKALLTKQLAGAALDVFEVEKAFSKDSPLLNTPHLVLTPHLGACTVEAQINVAMDVAAQIRETLLGSLPQSAVNLTGIRVSEVQGLRPLLACCRALGRIAGRMLEGALEEIIVTTEGDYTKENEQPLLMAAATEAIGAHCDSRVNFVNVRQVAQERMIRLVAAKTDQLTSRSGVKVEVRSSSRSVVVRGAAEINGDVLLITLDDVPVYLLLSWTPNASLKQASFSVVSPEALTALPSTEGQTAVSGSMERSSRLADGGHCMMLYSRHLDVPGALANVAAAVGEAGVNIANCYLGRKREKATGESVGIALFLVDPVAAADVERVVEVIRAQKIVQECKLFDI